MTEKTYISELYRRAKEFIAESGHYYSSGTWVNAGLFMEAIGFHVDEDSPIFNYEIPISGGPDHG